MLPPTSSLGPCRERLGSTGGILGPPASVAQRRTLGLHSSPVFTPGLPGPQAPVITRLLSSVDTWRAIGPQGTLIGPGAVILCPNTMLCQQVRAKHEGRHPAGRARPAWWMGGKELTHFPCVLFRSFSTGGQRRQLPQRRRRQTSPPRLRPRPRRGARRARRPPQPPLHPPSSLCPPRRTHPHPQTPPPRPPDPPRRPRPRLRPRRLHPGPPPRGALRLLRRRVAGAPVPGGGPLRPRGGARRGGHAPPGGFRGADIRGRISAAAPWPGRRGSCSALLRVLWMDRRAEG